LIDFVKPDRARDEQPFWLRYTENENTLWISARYDGGLETSYDLRNKWVDALVLRVISESPMWTEDDQEIDVLTFEQSLVATAGIVGREDGEWDRMYGVGGVPRGGDGARRVRIGPDGRVYVATEEGFLQVWDGENWEGEDWFKMDDDILDFAIDSEGGIYVVGLFLDEFGGPGGTYKYIAYWDGTSLNALGPGLNNPVNTIELAPDGNVWIGGQFLFTFGGGVVSEGIMMWNVSNNTWNAIGANNGVNEEVNSIAISSNGDIVYIGGNFTDESGNPGSGLNYVAELDVSANTFSAMGSGMNEEVEDIKIAPNGLVYACGVFSTADGLSAAKVASWNGTSWVALGDGVDARAWAMAIQPDNIIWMGGQFTIAGGIALESPLAIWNGSVWVHTDIKLAGTPVPRAGSIAISSNGDVYVCERETGRVGGDAIAAEIQVVNNLGTAEVFPTIEVIGPGRLLWIENQTTGNRLYMNVDLRDDEILTIDVGTKTITSSFRSQQFEFLRPNSDFGDFKLLPGNNTISMFLVNGQTALASIAYVPTHWSVDAVGTRR
jgi:hypothetical protein